VNLLESVPEDWIKATVGKYCDVQLGKMLQNDPVSEQDELKPYLRAINISKTGVDLSHEFRMWIRPSELERFRLCAGDILVSEGGDAGRTAIFSSNDEYYFQNAINRLRPQSYSKILPEFIYYWFTFLKVSGYVEMVCNVATIAHFTAEKVKAAPLVLPPLKAQQRIAQFLDQKTAQIDGLIEKKRALLERLAEKRQALITQAVTKGFNPKVPMKPSGIEWLGDIPAHWEVMPLKRRIIQIEQGWSPAAEGRLATPDEWGVLKSGCVNDGIFDEMSHKALPLGLEPRKQLEVKAGNILMCRASGSLRYIGSVALVENVRSNLMFSDKTYRINLDTEQLNEQFFVYSMAAKHIREQIILSVSGAEGLANNIAQQSVGNYLHCFPPLPEQLEIVQYLAKAITRLQDVNDAVEKSVNQLEEYRAAVITSAITGKLAFD